MHADIVTFPSHCAHPATDWTKLLADNDDSAIILAACCGANLDVKQWPEQHITVHHIEQCFYLFMQPEVVDHYISKGFHLITPGWLSGWKNQLEHKMGFDQASARACYGETAKTLMLVDTGTLENSEQLLAELSTYLDIPTERIDVGVEYYSQLLHRLIDDVQSKEHRQRLDEALKQQSEYAMVSELLGQLTDQKAEYDIIHSLLTTFQMLLAPQTCCYLPTEDDGFGQPVCMGQTLSQASIAAIDVSASDYGLLAADGFWIAISSAEESYGVIVIENLAFPQYRSRYLNMALMIRKVAALAINHARNFQKLSDLSHASGKGEVAREVVHNAGNVLNSINISVQHLQSLHEKSVTRTLPAIVGLMREQGDGLGEFITSDPKGRKLPDYFAQLATGVESEHQLWGQQFTELSEFVEHVRAIIQSQSASLRGDEAREPINPTKLLNRMIDMYADSIAQHEIHLNRKMGAVPACALQKHKVMQVLGNLLKNAIEALATIDATQRKLDVNLEMVGSDRFCFAICDHGPGISDELREKVFAHGFSTKEGHSGFGLHSAANLASEMHGRLTCRAGDNGVGACFRLELPLGMLHVQG